MKQVLLMTVGERLKGQFSSVCVLVLRFRFPFDPFSYYCARFQSILSRVFVLSLKQVLSIMVSQRWAFQWCVIPGLGYSFLSSCQCSVNAICLDSSFPSSKCC